MDFDLPTSRPPPGLRGDSLLVALGDLGHVGEASRVVGSFREPEVDRVPFRAAFPTCDAEPSLDVDDDPAPAALRPDELARWLERNS